MIEVIYAASISTNLSWRKEDLSVVSVENSKGDARLGKKPRLNRGSIKFGDEELEGMP